MSTNPGVLIVLLQALQRYVPVIDKPLIAVAVALSLFAVMLQLLPLESLLSWQRSGINQGELWRLLTGNLLHTNHWHLLMNLTAFWTILAIHHFHYNAAGLVLLLVLLALFEGLGLWWCYPSLQGYVGLSGLLHGLFSFGAVMDIRRGLKSGWLLLLGVTIKVAHEQLAGGSADLAQLISARVATESHLVGAISGVFLALIFIALRHPKRVAMG